MKTKRTIEQVQDPRNEALAQKLLSLTDEELSAIFDASPFYQKKMAQAIADIKSLKSPLDFTR
ncbi:hypothetical protein [Dyadobacter sp. MSC1_007]|jgi:endonuclease III-like uncharacterized protein|uniref:hypothetical protein n=1 Tax=Dyadobacter sp. MSC1_007 TaxID=2909264 RepID=UPI00202E634B|nr:hypothetical protein [Dyadobacter sp. MSC1_007]